MTWFILFIVYLCFVFISRWLNLILYRMSNYEWDWPAPELWVIPIVNIIATFILSLMIVGRLLSRLFNRYFNNFVKWFVGQK